MKKSIKIASQLFSQVAHFPATELFNEGWMLRLVLDWYSKNSIAGDKLEFLIDSDWFSEAQLPTHFTVKNHYRNLNEGRTHADGIIGHFKIQNNTVAGLELLPNAKQFLVIEAKMKSGLSESVSKVTTFSYHQVARSVACMAESIKIAGMKPQDLNSLGFYVIAPKQNTRIKIGYLDMKNIEAVLRNRCDTTDTWFDNIFIPLLNKIYIKFITWEEIIEEIKSRDSVFGIDIEEFYNKCKTYNRIK